MPIIGSPELLEADSSIDQAYMRSGSRRYLVYATVDMDENQVRGGTPFALYQVHPTDNRQLVQGLAVKLHSPNVCSYDSYTNPAQALHPPVNGTACYVWEMTITYGPWVPFENTTTGDPADQPIQVFYEGQTYQAPCEVDINGTPVLNTAYDPYDPPVTRDQTRPIIRVIRNETSFSASAIQAVADKVNSDTVGPYAPRTLKASAPRGTLKYSQFQGATYYEVEYVFMVNDDTWDAQPLSQGLNEFVQTQNGAVRRKILVQGQPATAPLPLDVNGAVIPPPVTSANAYYQRFQVYELISYADTFDFPTGTFS